MTNHRLITGLSNPTVKKLRALRIKKHRKASRKFLAEGLRILADAQAFGHSPEILLMSKDRDPHPILENLIKSVTSNGGEVLETSCAILSKITGKSNPQAVVGVYAELDTSIDKLRRSTADIWLVAHTMRDPGNLGTLLRTGDAVGAGGLILIDDCTDPFSFEAVRASMGAIFTQKIALTRWQEFYDWLRGGPGQLVGASLKNAVHYRDAKYESPCFILLGNESQGLPEKLESLSDIRVTMPMHGHADSLNAAVAGSILAYEVLAGLKKTR